MFLHPDLGIGGAERLVVDAAVAMRHRGHSVRFVTNHHSRTHCFDETRDGTFPVNVVGDWLPRTVFGRCYALCSYARMLYAAAFVSLLVAVGRIAVDVVFVDQVSACVPLLKLLLPRDKCRVVFYCHFPDQLLATGRDTLLKRLYRGPIDWLEEATTGAADALLVNSQYTLSVFQKTFKGPSRTPPRIVYPSINTAAFDRIVPQPLEGKLVPGMFNESIQLLLSINRFERKKNLAMAVHCLRLVCDPTVKLVIAGGYDPMNSENVEHFRELVHLVIDQDLADRVFFLKSPSDALKVSLLKRCVCLLYTPSHEHFGIVPLEAMYYGKPVVAVNSGGPKETIVHGHNGYLCEAYPQDFADAVVKLLAPGQAELFGLRGRQRFDELFSFAQFENNINNVLEDLYTPQR